MKSQLRPATMMPALISLGFILAIDSRADNSSKKDVNLPAAVRKTFEAKFPKAKIEKVDAETENGVEVYDFEFKDGDSEKETDIAEDGTLLESTLVIQTKDVPKDAMKAIRKAAGDAKMGRTEKIEVEYELKDGKVTKLAKTELQYAVELTKDGKHSEVTVDPKGKVVEAPHWEEDKPEAAAK
jgi:uncharacterized membrane protein YkoI